MTSQYIRSVAVAAIATFIFSIAVHAQIKSQSGKIGVVKPENLPEEARIPGDSLFLRSTRKGGLYLYVEQQKGSELTVFNVTDPADIKGRSTKQLTVPGVYDFIRPLGDNAELVRFRHGTAAAGVLNMSKEDDPELRSTSNIKATPHTIVLDETNSSATDEAYKYVPAVPHDYEAVDSSSKDKSEIVMTVKEVEHEITNKDIGTTLLLGSGGLTVIRRNAAEEAYKAQLHEMDAR